MRITLPVLKTIYNIRQYKTAMWYLYFFKNKHLEVFQNDCFVILILNYNFKVSYNFGNILKMPGEKEDTILLPSNSTKKISFQIIIFINKNMLQNIPGWLLVQFDKMILVLCQQCFHSVDQNNPQLLCQN